MNRILLPLCTFLGACANGTPEPQDVDTSAPRDTDDDGAEVSDDSSGDGTEVSDDSFGTSDVVEEIVVWPTSPRLIVDGVEGAVRGDEYGTQSMARAVGDDLYVEVQWSITSPHAGHIRVGLRLQGAATADVVASLGEDRLEVFGVEHVILSPIAWARLFATDPRPTGRVRVQHAEGTTTLWLELQASLTALSAEPREPLTVALEDRVKLEVETRSSYAGTCSSAPKAYYIPLQVDGYRASYFDWESVERDCQRNQAIGCVSTGAGACGDGDRWLCAECFADACVKPGWQDECYPR